jgi:hypothetical protein
MVQQELLPTDTEHDDKNKFELNRGMTLRIEGEYFPIAILSIRGVVVKKAKLKDRIERKLFIVEAVTLGAKKSRLAAALKISRQTIDNYLDVKEHFGLEGLIRGYSLKDTKDIRKHRKNHTGNSDFVPCGALEQIAEIKREKKARQEEQNPDLPFSFGSNANAQPVETKNQPFFEEHDWKASRYAGTFVYLIALISQWKWLKLVMGYFGDKYQIFMVFLLMASQNIRSVEQLKNVRSREAGIVLGIKQIANRHKVWEWFYGAAGMRTASLLVYDYFRYQIHAGLVGIWMWFTDGHLLPYTGKEKVHHSYNTQRRMPVPGQTNMVTCDVSGCIVDFNIQEGKGDLRKHIRGLAKRWEGDVPVGAIMVFDREGSGVEFFSKLVREDISFVTWEKNVKSQKLMELDDGDFDKNLKFNDKHYSYFEGEKLLTYTPEECSTDEPHTFTLRRLYIWNKTSNRRTCGLAWTGKKEVSSEDCVKAILSRWGASENTFKHISDRHPLHYHPGFKMVESEKQDIANPEVKEKKKLISRAKKELTKLLKKLAKAKVVLNKDESTRKNSKREQLIRKVEDQEKEIERLQKEKKEMPDRIDVTTLEDYKSFKQVDNEGKELFDFVTTSVWNARKHLIDWLRPLYNCENELVDLFYAITYCHGWVKSTKREVIVRLEPIEQPKRRQTQEQLCRKLSGLGAYLPTGKILRIEVGESPI